MASVNTEFSLCQAPMDNLSCGNGQKNPFHLFKNLYTKDFCRDISCWQILLHLFLLKGQWKFTLKMAKGGVHPLKMECPFNPWRGPSLRLTDDQLSQPRGPLLLLQREKWLTEPGERQPHFQGAIFPFKCHFISSIESASEVFMIKSDE